ncbi:MAG: hypothetical protein Q4A54_07570 [Parabacteroides sp.]|nr:hypothetical protein [Parabacteroides sp.]
MNDIFGDAYVDMMVFDSLIVNRDRHLGNFGMLIDNNTGSYLQPAPIFDNGYSLLLGAAKHDLTDGYEQYVESLDCRYFSKNRQAKLFVQERHLPKLRKLLKFEFKQHPRYPIEEKTLNVMSRFIQERARDIISIYHEKVTELKKVLDKK